MDHSDAAHIMAYELCAVQRIGVLTIIYICIGFDV